LVFAAKGGADAHPVVRRLPKTIEVNMVNNGGGKPMTNRFEPQDITIQVGDTVKFMAVSGNHNIAFWKDSIPAGADVLIQKAIGAEADTVRALQTKRYPTAGTGFTLVFAGFPKGVYKYFCQPHLMRMMVGTITVQ
jgi:plastocyanin